MVRIKLNELKQEISKYIGLPYFSNVKKLALDNVFVGKGTAHEIALETINFANQQNIKLVDLTADQIYNFQKKHHLGIDCSGLVYHLLHFINPKIENFLVGTDNKFGVRRLSANLLTSAPNAHPISDYSQVQTGDLIRMDSGKHVVFIVEKIDNTIHYVHSSQKTKSKGVHFGTITLIKPTLPLNHQTWSDVTQEGQDYSSYFNPKNGDGVFRLFLFD